MVRLKDHMLCTTSLHLMGAAFNDLAGTLFVFLNVIFGAVDFLIKK